MVEWKSQSHQDEFVHLILPKTNGTFLDIGSHDPVHINNTYELEKMGWRGFLFDVDAGWKTSTSKYRTSPFIAADVSTFDWDTFLTENNLVGCQMDYLSFDVDEASLATLRRFPFDKVSFRVCTIEHDRYISGMSVATEMREIMSRNGYILVCKDITNQGSPYEDWYVHSTIANRVEGLYCEGLDWEDALKKVRTHYQDRS